MARGRQKVERGWVGDGKGSRRPGARNGLPLIDARGAG